MESPSLRGDGNIRHHVAFLYFVAQELLRRIIRRSLTTRCDKNSELAEQVAVGK